MNHKWNVNTQIGSQMKCNLKIGMNEHKNWFVVTWPQLPLGTGSQHLLWYSFDNRAKLHFWSKKLSTTIIITIGDGVVFFGLQFWEMQLLHANPSQDSSVGSTSAWYRGGPGFKSQQGQEFFNENIVSSIHRVLLYSK